MSLIQEIKADIFQEVRVTDGAYDTLQAANRKLAEAIKAVQGTVKKIESAPHITGTDGTSPKDAGNADQIPEKIQEAIDLLLRTPPVQSRLTSAFENFSETAGESRRREVHEAKHKLQQSAQKTAEAIQNLHSAKSELGALSSTNEDQKLQLNAVQTTLRVAISAAKDAILNMNNYARSI